MKLVSKKPLTIAEVAEYVPDSEDKTAVRDYIHKFNKTDKSKAVKMKENILALGNPKIKEEDAVKIVDLMPTDSEDLNKIFTDVSLTEEEINSILEIVKKN